MTGLDIFQPVAIVLPISSSARAVAYDPYRRRAGQHSSLFDVS
jgi:hypothetical protein